MKRRIILLLIGLICVFAVSLFGTSTITSWMKDMYNQPSVKPQEYESINAFPAHVISADGREYNPPLTPFDSVEIDFKSYLPPENRLESYHFNRVEGKRMFLTYCAVCHGPGGQLNDGKGTRVSRKGLKVVRIKDLPTGYYYDRILRGGVQMPPMGYRMTDRERWDVANYIDSFLP
ncbi:MAG: cytochrome c [Deltaproteobacteria bacterium]|nr:cytochrome c [Deltaproteobacteria bacterium]